MPAYCEPPLSDCCNTHVASTSTAASAMMTSIHHQPALCQHLTLSRLDSDLLRYFFLAPFFASFLSPFLAVPSASPSGPALRALRTGVRSSHCRSAVSVSLVTGWTCGRRNKGHTGVWERRLEGDGC